MTRQHSVDGGLRAAGRRLTTRLLVASARRGKVGRALATQSDLLREAGIAEMRAQRAQAGAAAEWGPRVRSLFYRSLWERAADAVGAEVHQLDGDFLELRRDGVSTTVCFHLVMFDDALTLRLALDKGVVHGLLERRGIPMPDHLVFRPAEPRAGQVFLDEGGGLPCVVKPATGTSGGEGVTCGVRSREELDRATFHAARWSDGVLIERQALGDEYRLLFLDGELLDVVRRRSPHVVGDGERTIAELVAGVNIDRAESEGRAGLSFLAVDLDCLLTLRRAGLSLRSVPDPGAVVAVKSAVNQNGSADNETIPASSLSPDVVRACADAVAAVGTRLGGVEVMTPDPTRPLAAAGGVVLEVNGTPGLHYHYLVREPERATPVAVPILETLLAEAKRRDARTLRA
jgi:D-alanine-D-alanine ligase-like ATP-grasp enzyme